MYNRVYIKRCIKRYGMKFLYSHFVTPSVLFVFHILDIALLKKICNFRYVFFYELEYALSLIIKCYIVSQCNK